MNNKFKIINKYYSELLPQTKKRLRSLSLRDIGSMCKVVKKAPCDTFILYDNDLIVGWGIYLLDDCFIYNFAKIIYSKNSFMLYIRKSYRRRKLGEKLLKECVKKYGKLIVYPWDNKSNWFFEKTKDKYKNIEIPSKLNSHV